MRILREPLLHFLLIGAAIFAVSMLAGRGSAGVAPASDKQIVVTPEKVALLKNGFVLDYGRNPTETEIQRLIDGYVREEVLVREARAQGLDRDDSVVRRWLVRKMEFAVAEPAAPADSQLQDYLAQHAAVFRTADGKIPTLAEIHSAVLAAWMNEKRQQAVDRMYQAYRATYQVSVQVPPTTKPGAGT